MTHKNEAFIPLESYDSLPPLGVVVECLVQGSDFSNALPKVRRMRKKVKLKRILSSIPGLVWHWSAPEIDTYFTHKVVLWRFL